ncbi:cytochrome c [Pontibacter sp. E15-1]|uniref:c-type cytochrome n=1 Tax=Pontibacter sp. E15-1 TaxID=2919918 RepID=UPI001F4FB675|nr:cytochrome c [Pontibacter sp. E15-1]MCJ8165051.1 cytochrome c [Pontibacter sp. E15-1]
MFKGIIAAMLITSGYFYTSQTDTAEASIKRGKAVYTANCQSCHMAEGQGIPGAFPPLAKSDFLMQDQKRAIGVVLNGLNDEIKVNGQTYHMQMPSHAFLTDQQVADVLTFVQNNWGNKAKPVTPAQVKELRKK